MGGGVTTKDDPKFNILFVKEVEKHPVLYNYNLQGYVNKYEQEKRWNMVAAALNESTAGCKEKWKNLRSSLCRHLRNQSSYGPGMRCKKSYYLAKYMEYLIPFIKIRQPGQYTNSVVDTIKEEDFQDEYVDDFTPEMEMVEGEQSCTPTEMQSDDQPDDGMNSPFLNPISPVQELHELPIKTVQDLQEHPDKKRKIEWGNSYEKLAKEYFSLKSEVEAQPEDTDLLFLKSLLPEMHKMGDRQKNKFKMMILNGIDEILYQSVSNGPSSCTSNRTPPHQVSLTDHLDGPAIEQE